MLGMCRRWRVLACIPDNASGDKRVQDLRQSDPRDDRFEILARKKPLLRGLCLWVHDDIAFPRWRSGDDIRILWLHRDPGKGRTMVMTALVDEISKRLHRSAHSARLSYFFCQSTNSHSNTATSILRGLIYL